MPPLLISVHIPKAAGTSFRHWLDGAYGSGGVFYDYADRPLDPSAPMNADPEGFLAAAKIAPPMTNGIAAIHGHFWAKKYAHLTNAFRATFLRHPIERTISHYFFWLNTPPHGHALHDMLLREKLDIVQFAQLPPIATLYSKVFFRDTDIAAFDFVGDHARFASDFAALARALGHTSEIAVANANPQPGYRAQRAALTDDPATMRALEAALAADIDFYEKALAPRQDGFRR